MRWILTEPSTSATWTMPINPDRMTSPFPVRKNISTAYGSRKGTDRVRSFMSSPDIHEWSWEGVIRSEEHYDSLVEWASKTSAIHVTDHLNRTWEVVFRKFEPTDRKPTANVPWRLRYKMTALVLRRVS